MGRILWVAGRQLVILDLLVSLLILVSRLRASRQTRGQPSRVTKSLASQPAQVARPSPCGRPLIKQSLSLKPA